MVGTKDALGALAYKDKSRFTADLIVAKSGTRDYTSIQSAIDALGADEERIFIKKGTYEESLVVERSNDDLLGMGKKTIIKNDALNAIIVGDNTNTYENIKIRNLVVDGASASGFVVWFKKYISKIVIENVEVINEANNPFFIQNSEEAILRNIVTDLTTLSRGIYLHTCEKIIVRDCFISGTASYYGISLMNSRLCQILGNQIKEIQSEAIGIEDSGVGDWVGNIVMGNVITELNGAEGIHIHSNVKESIIKGNYVEGAGEDGIFIDGKKNIIVGNIVKNSSKTTAGSYSGISLYGAGVEENDVKGNICFDDQGTKTQNYGIEEETGADYNSICGNICRGNLHATKDISYVGANSKICDNIGRYTPQGCD